MQEMTVLAKTALLNSQVCSDRVIDTVEKHGEKNVSFLALEAVFPIKL